MWSPTHVQVTVQRAKNLLTKGKHKTNDCFVTIALGKEKYQTSVKEKASKDVEWHEECELLIPEQGNTAEIILTALHRNFLGVDEFLGTISIPLSSFDVYERPKNRWYTLGSKPGKENTKERGELEVKIGFIVKAGSLTDLSHKERHKSSLGQLSTAAHSIGGSLLSIGSFEKRKGLKKLAKSIGNRVKGKSKHNLDKGDDLNEKDERKFRTTRQEPGEADPGVISEDEDEFTFDDLSHKSSASSLNAPVVANSNSVASIASSNSSSNNFEAHHVPPAPTNAAPNKPPRFSMSASTTSLSKVDNIKEDEWGLKLYGKQVNNNVKRWDSKASPKIVIDEPKDEYRESSPINSPSSTLKRQELPEIPSPAPREVLLTKNKLEDKFASTKEKNVKEEKLKEKKEDKYSCWSPKDEKQSRKDKKKEKENKFKDFNDDNNLSGERIIIGGEDAIKTTASVKSHLPHEILAQFEGKSREDLIELTLQLQAEVTDKKKRLNDLEDYIDALLLRVIECSPRLLQNPYQSQRRLSSPGHQ
ncbi:rab11 interacting protein [Bombus vancouverensis nearcticus]|uniref:Rab11 family-interacting protein 2 n=2 Tax=Pyrobombus TaxID=144703 RepID=A0A6P8MB33_9HYME|nr:rab11 family-interacting protein 2 [Bombus impatiens]XP_033305328.1 rab11 family-interacting protein 2 [Bombus bifarius]